MASGTDVCSCHQCRRYVNRFDRCECCRYHQIGGKRSGYSEPVVQLRSLMNADYPVELYSISERADDDSSSLSEENSPWMAYSQLRKFPNFSVTDIHHEIQDSPKVGSSIQIRRRSSKETHRVLEACSQIYGLLCWPTIVNRYPDLSEWNSLENVLDTQLTRIKMDETENDREKLYSAKSSPVFQSSPDVHPRKFFNKADLLMKENIPSFSLREGGALVPGVLYQIWGQTDPKTEA